MSIENIRGNILKIERFALDDGPGIRTTVFFKGCPLNCLWCHNPESIEMVPELVFHQDLCIGCGRCSEVCTESVHVLNKGKHELNREKCKHCGACVKECYSEAIEMLGSSFSVKQLLEKVLEDRRFYENSGGGVTISGGEPMYQFDFLSSFLKHLKQNNIHVCLDTCGYAPLENYNQILSLVDIFLFDIKEFDKERHKEFTGVSNELIFKNLYNLDRMGAQIILRCPIIPNKNFTRNHLSKIRTLCLTLKNVIGCDLLPYNNAASIKYKLLRKRNPMAGIPSLEEKEITRIQEMTIINRD